MVRNQKHHNHLENICIFKLWCGNPQSVVASAQPVMHLAASCELVVMPQQHNTPWVLKSTKSPTTPLEEYLETL